MTNNEFDKIFRDKLETHCEPVDDSVWAAIESTLASAPVAKKPVVLPFGKRGAFGYGAAKIRRAGYYAVCVAAVLVIALFLMKPADSVIENTVIGVDVIEEGAAVAESVSEENVSEGNVSEESVNIVKEEVPELLAMAEQKEIAIPETKPAVGKPEEVPVDGEIEKVPAEEIVGNESENKSQSETILKTDNSKSVGNSTNYAYNWSDADQKQKRRGKGYTIALSSNIVASDRISAFSQYMGTMASAGVSYADNYMQSMEMISEAKFSLPINIAVQAQIKLSSNFAVGVGLSYTRLKSKYDGMINKKVYHVKQNLYYIGMPVNAYFTLVNKKNLYLYANIGGAIEKGVKASYKLSSYDGTLRETSADIDGFQYSVNSGLGLEYRFADFVGLYIEPNIVYYIDSDVPASIRTDQPLQLKAELGFRFHIK